MPDKNKEGPFKGMTDEQVRSIPNHQYEAMKKSYAKEQKKEKRSSMSLLDKLSSALGGK